jgi:ABC-type enterochelin transport system substrate-binding protein
MMIDAAGPRARIDWLWTYQRAGVLAVETREEDGSFGPQVSFEMKQRSWKYCDVSRMDYV